MKMSIRHVSWWLLACLWFLTACVTVNVYFPAAAAEKAADSIIDDVWGEPPDVPQPEPSEQTQRSTRQTLISWDSVLNVLVPVAEAAPNLNIDTPAINKLKKSMRGRDKRLRPYLRSGAVGLTRDGLVAIRDLNAVPAKDRGGVKKLVADENRDRNALYREIAKANGRPEWEPDVRKTFARQWINRAPRGWWYQGKGWQKK